MKERNYLESLERESQTEKVYASHNKLSKYGNDVAMRKLLSIPEIERACKFAKFDFEELTKEFSHGFVSVEQKENFISKRDHWFTTLKNKMKDLRISKETLESFGLSWKSAKTFAYQTI